MNGALLVNTVSGRAAVATSAPGQLDADGAVIARRRLHRPKSRETIPAEALAQSEWRSADLVSFRKAWQTEAAAIPPFTDDMIHLITGLLLPVWDRLGRGKHALRVYRLETDEGERLIGRVIPPDTLPQVLEAFGAGLAMTVLTPEATFMAILHQGQTLNLQGDLALRRSLIMGAHRIELSGFSDTAVPQLKALGLTSEIIAWKLRLFVPACEANGPGILGRLFERWPVRHSAEQSITA